MTRPLSLRGLSGWAARLILREVITLADEASTLTDLELRDRLRALAQGAR
jgi:hypothetical protein